MKTRKSKCKHCGLSIRWVRLPSKKWIPIDPRPDRKGTVIASRYHHYACNASKTTPKVLPHGIERFTAHASTCPHDLAEAQARHEHEQLDAAQVVVLDGKARAAGDRDDED